MSIVKLTEEHKPLLYGFMIANSPKGYMSHHRRGPAVLLDNELGYLYLNDMLTLGVIKDGKLKQVAFVFADGSNNLIMRYLYGEYTDETPALLDAIRKYAVVMFPNIDRYSFVVGGDEIDAFLAAWNDTAVSKQASELQWNECKVNMRPSDLWLRDIVLGCGVPQRFLYVMSTTINYTIEEQLP
jgi:hypothetical protein